MLSTGICQAKILTCRADDEYFWGQGRVFKKLRIRDSLFWSLFSQRWW